MGLIITRDTREHACGYAFSDGRFGDVSEVRDEGLPTGDYSMPGFYEGAVSIAVERKELNDFISCCLAGSEKRKNGNRERFEKELLRASRTLDRFAVIIEGSMDDIKNHNYTSKIKPQSVVASINAWFIRYGVPFVFAGSRRAAEWMTYDLLRKYLAEIERRWQWSVKAKSVA